MSDRDLGRYLESPAWEREAKELFDLAVASLRAEGLSAEEAEEAHKKVLHEIQNDAMGLHYRQGVAHAVVDAWYVKQLRELAGR